MEYRYDLSGWANSASGDGIFKGMGISFFAALIALVVIAWVLVLFIKKKQSKMEKRVIQRARLIYRENRQAGNSIAVDYIAADLDTGERIRVTVPSNRKQLHNLIVGDTGCLVYLYARGGRFANIMQDFYL